MLRQSEDPKQDEIGKAKMEEEDDWRPVPQRGLSVRRRASEQNGIGKVKMKRIEESKIPMSLSFHQLEIQHSIKLLTRESSLNSSICTISPITLSVLLNDLEFQEKYKDKLGAKLKQVRCVLLCFVPTLEVQSVLLCKRCTLP